ncbi:MAG: choice-of-anchor D domain-containing protein [Chthoniobacterales bacterium]|nr:choice-of-anchor D domain-containing protein [Chthoniobacterales bacterium]
MKHILISILFSIMLSAHAALAGALTASDGAANDEFGESVSVAGSTVLVGAARDDDKGNNSGSVYAFANAISGSPTQYKLTASDGAASDLFGGAVSMSGNTALAGAVFGDGIMSNSGSAYVFVNAASGSPTQYELTASDGATDDFFGHAVGLSGSTALVGAPQDDDKGTDSGSAYVFSNATSGSPTQRKLTASDGATLDYFGIAVSLSGSTALVGAYHDDDKGNASGSAYVFVNATSATPTQYKLTASDGTAGDWFGGAVSLDGSTALIGAHNDDDKGSFSGSAYVFVNATSATPTQYKLTASDAAVNDNFGIAVSLSGSTALIGAYRGDDKATDSGSAYLFLNANTASPAEIKLSASDGAVNDYFGYSVGLDGDNFAVGAYRKNTYRGKVYTGSVSSFSTLDAGNTSKTIDGISFISQEDWIIGKTTDTNQVTLGSGDTGAVTAPGKSVYVGKLAGSDDNRLIINGSLTANGVYVGAAGNAGNVVEVHGTLAASGGIFVAAGSSIGGDGVIQGEMNIAEGASFVGDLTLPSGSTVSGGGTVEGNLILEAGAQLVFDPAKTLTVTGTVALGGNFGIDDILGLDSSTAVGTYKLIDGTGTDFSLQISENWGPENAHNLGNGKFAYFQQGSLELVVETPTPEIAVSGKGLGITSGDITPNAADGTDFGSASIEGGSIVHTFEISNTGSAGLTLTSTAPDHVTISGPGFTAFTVTAQPPSPLVPPQGAQSFTVRFAPPGVGTWIATIGIANDDSDENPFTFDVTGNGLTSKALFDVTASGAGLAGADAEPDATPFHDGVENLVKYAFNMNLAGPDSSKLVAGTGTSGLPNVSLSDAGEATLIRVEFIRRRNSGLIYTPKRSGTLTPGSFGLLTALPVVTPINAIWERVVVEETTAMPAAFIIVEVTLP